MLSPNPSEGEEFKVSDTEAPKELVNAFFKQALPVGLIKVKDAGVIRLDQLALSKAMGVAKIAAELKESLIFQPGVSLGRKPA